MKIKFFIFITVLVTSYVFSQKIIEKDLLIKNEKIELPGTLTYTKTSKKLIIWIHGSGNVDRNGNQKGVNVRANYIKQFRDEMNKNNIAFFSYDKRTSNPKNAAFLKNVILDDFVMDAKKVIDHLKKEKQFEEIILIGHSQGSLIAMLASEGVHKYISLAGPSESINETIVKQISTQSAELGKTTENHFKELKETGDIKEVNPMLASIFSKPNYPFLKNWMSYNPTKEISRLKIPMLIINGTKDIQVSVEDAKALNSANKKSELKIIENMNHVLKHIEKDSDNMSSYYSPDYKLSSELVKTITQFVNK
ncbi:MAG: alpha/beta hydrolase [Flavobacteriaceae bacterium]|nr:alpha/beta hydrolase [Flavobacteriaceae bacterium]